MYLRQSTWWVAADQATAAGFTPGTHFWWRFIRAKLREKYLIEPPK